MATWSEIYRADAYRRKCPNLWREASDHFTADADLGAVVRRADYLAMSQDDRAVADFWEAWRRYEL